jgi:hypothetical protein
MRAGRLRRLPLELGYWQLPNPDLQVFDGHSARLPQDLGEGDSDRYQSARHFDRIAASEPKSDQAWLAVPLQGKESREVEVVGDDGPTFLPGKDEQFLIRCCRRQELRRTHDIPTFVPEKRDGEGRNVEVCKQAGRR